MEPGDNEILKTIIAHDKSDILKRFFDTSSVDQDLNSAARDQLKELFQKYGHGDFDAFILRIHSAIFQGINPCITSNPCTPDALITCDSSSQTNNTRDSSSQTNNTRDMSTQTNNTRDMSTQTTTISDRGYDRFSQTINFRNKKCMTEFDPLTFLTFKKFKKDYSLLEFQDDSDTFDELLYCSRKSFSMSYLKNLAYQVESLNQIYKYRILELKYV